MFSKSMLSQFSLDQFLLWFGVTHTSTKKAQIWLIFAVLYRLMREVALQIVKCDLTDFAKFCWKLHKYSPTSNLQIQKYPRTNINTI